MESKPINPDEWEAQVRDDIAGALSDMGNESEALTGFPSPSAICRREPICIVGLYAVYYLLKWWRSRG